MSNAILQPARCVLLGLALASGGAAAATFTVDSALDVIPAGDSNPGDGICEDERSGSRCTLRAAIEEANAGATDDRIEFAVDGTIAIIGSALPVITDQVTILGITAPGFEEGDSLETSQPTVFISGGLLGGTPNGLQFRNVNAATSQVLGLGIVLFGGSGIAAGTSADGLVLRGNYIGIEADGTAAGNGTGVFLVGDGNQVGLSGNPGISSGIGNVISASSGDGVTIVGNGNRVRGNMIGVTDSGSGDRGNAGHGIVVIGGSNLVGDINARDGNTVTYNGGDGIRISGGANTVRYNLVGGAGISTFGNDGHGIAVYGDGNLIGDLGERAGNIVRGNTLNGVHLGADGGVASDSNLVGWNRISDNTDHGIEVANGSGNRVLANTVFGNDRHGITLSPGASGTYVHENMVGFFDSVLGTPFASGNEGDGVHELGSGNWIGAEEVDGVLVLRPNIVGGNGLDGIWASGANVHVAGNLVGVGSEGEDLGNAGSGIKLLDTATGAIVASNVVGFNGLDGVRVQSNGTLVCGNSIGVAEAFTEDSNVPYVDIGNTFQGLRLNGDVATVGDPDCGGNLIGFNGADGIGITGAGNEIQYYNLIGGDAAAGVDFGNDGAGVLLEGSSASGNIIGENSMAANGGAGVRLSATAGTGNLLDFNAFRDNGVTGIDLGDSGFTPNDPGDADSGPNMLQNTPELLTATLDEGMLELTYRVDSSAVDSAYPIEIEIQLADGSGRRQGIRTLDFDIYDTPGAVATVAIATELTGGRLVAIATDALKNSSEFSAELVFGRPDQLFGDGFEAMTP